LAPQEDNKENVDMKNMDMENIDTEKKSKNPLLQFGVIPLASVLLGFVVATLLTLFMLRSSINDDFQTQSVKRSADNLQLRLDQSQEQLIKQAKSMAASIHLTELVTNGDSAARSLEETRLREMIPYARTVRLFKTGEAKTDPTAFPPFKYQSLDMVNRAEQGETVYPEAINADGLWVIALAAPIKTPSNNSIYGSLFIYYDITVFSDTLIDSLEGHLSLVQTFSSAPESEILQAGLSNEQAAVHRKLINPNIFRDFYTCYNLISYFFYLFKLLLFLFTDSSWLRIS